MRQALLNSYFGSDSHLQWMVIGQTPPLEARLWLTMTTPINHPNYRVRPVKHFTDAKCCQSLQTNERRHQEATWQPSSQPWGSNNLTRGPLVPTNSRSGSLSSVQKQEEPCERTPSRRTPCKALETTQLVQNMTDQLCLSWVWFSSTAGHLR